MKRQMFIAGFILVFTAEVIALVIFAAQPSGLTQDTVAVNEIVMSVTQNFDSLENYENTSELDYTVLDGNGNLVYKTATGLSESVNAAIAHRDTILDVVSESGATGKVIIYNYGAQTLQAQKETAVAVLSVSAAVQCLICIGYAAYIRFTVIRPFNKLKNFARRVAGGNLDIPLEMDRKNLFGAFTESFDIMRAELKKARLAEAQARKSKKELVAKLSHDIKTPVSSIKAVSEVGIALTDSEKDRENYLQIILKSDQINALVTNLFTATLEELQQLTVTPSDIESYKIKDMLKNADYLRKAALPEIPECLIFADALRLQQVFDNIFSNSYKYAKTEISVSAELGENSLDISIEDFGGGVSPEDLPVIKEKFRRGDNSVGTEGAGLGLYISDRFMKEMDGSLNIVNGVKGLKVTVSLRLSGKPQITSDKKVI